jgi:hypothetical protein
MSQLEAIFEEINAKLGALISLSLIEKDINLKEKIELLSKAGLKNVEIAKILGISQMHVAKEKSLAKNKEEKQNGKKAI